METKRPTAKIATSTDGKDRALAREMIDRIGDKWTLLIIATLGESEKMRFTELRDRIEGISQKMLTKTLRQLERDGLLSRKVYPVVPPKVEYRLTNLSIAVAGMFFSMSFFNSYEVVGLESIGFDTRTRLMRERDHPFPIGDLT